MPETPFDLHLKNCFVCPAVKANFPNLRRFDHHLCETGALLFRNGIMRPCQLVWEARVSILARIAKYNDPHNLDWEWSDAGDKWERHALSAVQDLVAAERLIVQLLLEQEGRTMPTTSHNPALTGANASRQAKAQILPPPVPDGETVSSEADVIRVWSLPDTHCEDCHALANDKMSWVAVGNRLIPVCCTVTENFKRATGQIQ